MPAEFFTGSSVSTSYAFGDLWYVQGQVLLKPRFVAILFPLTQFKVLSSLTWTTDPNPMISPVDHACIKLRVAWLEANGWDDYRVDGVVGQRELGITLRCESYGKSEEASEILNRVMTGLNTPDVTPQLNAIGLAYADCGRINYLSYTSNEREVNTAIMTLTFNAASNLVRDPYGNFGFIAKVDGDDLVPGEINR